MKQFKRILAIVLTLTIVICSFSLTAFAKNESDAKQEKEYVAEMYICHKARKAYLSGHTWIYIKNLTKHKITVGLYTLDANKGVSLGTFGYSIADGRGLYYNAEAYRYRKTDMSDVIYVSKKLTEKQLNTVSGKLTRSGYWAYVLNCGFFAISTWNMVWGYPMFYFMFPTVTMLSILVYPSHKKGFTMPAPTLNEVYKQKGFGKNARLVKADPTVVSHGLFAANFDE